VVVVAVASVVAVVVVHPYRLRPVVTLGLPVVIMIANLFPHLLLEVAFHLEA
jgi:hypothetical protein